VRTLNSAAAYSTAPAAYSTAAATLFPEYRPRFSLDLLTTALNIQSVLNEVAFGAWNAANGTTRLDAAAARVAG
jgi:hypothetical protein